MGQQFQKGRQKTGGRKVGVRNRISDAFLRDLLDDYKKNGGKEAIKLCRIERPVEYAKMIMTLLPKEEVQDVTATVRTIVTGVPRAGDDPTPRSPGMKEQAAPPMLPKPKSPAENAAPSQSEPPTKPAQNMVRLLPPPSCRDSSEFDRRIEYPPSGVA